MQPLSAQLKNKLLILLLPLVMAVVINAGSVPDVCASIATGPAPVEKEHYGAKKSPAPVGPNVWQWVDPLGLACDKPTKGYADIFHYPGDETNRFGHYSVETSDFGDFIHTHQVVTASDNSQTMIASARKFPPSKKMDNVVKVKIPDIYGAQNYQKKMIGKQLGPYSRDANSCVDHVAEVLRAGGVDVPKTPIGQYKYLKGLGF